jgi:nucleoside-diphosphate kinase
MKPDAVQRGVVGEILARFERAGLKIIGSKLMEVDKALTMKHYQKDSEWHKKIGGFNIEDCEKFGLDVKDIFGTDDPEKIGRTVNEWLFDIFSSGPVFAFVFEGPSAVSKIRTLVGSTFPETAPPGTIRGDFGLDSGFSSLKRKRACFNLIHASGTPDEAEAEIDMWFKPEEIITYSRSDHGVYNY